MARLGAPAGSCRHLITLTATAEVRGLHPFVLIYSLPGPRTRTTCGQPSSIEGGLYLLGADAAAAVADGAHTSRVSRDRLLALCDPLPCLICRSCHDSLLCLSPRLEGLAPRPNRRIPSAIRQLLAGRLAGDAQPVAGALSVEETAALLIEAGLHRYQAVCAYDLQETGLLDIGSPRR